MNPDPIDRAATLLFQARTQRTTLAALPPDCVPQDASQAYAVQRRVLALSGQPVAGWKVGAKSPTAEPTCAPLPADAVLASPADAGAAGGLPAGALIEAEFAVRLARDLPPRERPYTAAEVVDAVDAFLPAIELVVSRFDDFRAQPALATLADSSSNFALVVGAPVRAFALDDLSRLAVRVTIGTAVAADTVGGNPARDPWRLLAWLANVGSAWAGGLKRGQVVTTGSFVGMLPAAAGDHVAIDVAGVGAASVRL